jgi:heavy metal translocating P-type ATPase
MTKACALCGLARGRSDLRLEVSGDILSFCCPACLHIFQILHNSSGEAFTDFRGSDLFRASVAEGLIAAAENNGPEGRGRRFVAQADGGHMAGDRGIEAVFTLEGMSCVSCTWLIEEILRKMDGVLGAEAVFMADTVKVRYLPHRINRSAIVKKLEQFGYQARPLGEQSSSDQKKSFLHLGIASILTFNIMMISFAVYGGFLQELGKTGISTLSLPLCLLAAPVVFYSGWPIIKRGWFGLKSCRFPMDTLIAVGALTTYGYSVYQMLHGSLHLYFDTAAMLITLVLFGRFLENRIRRKVTAGFNMLHDLIGSKVRTDREGRVQWVAASSIKVGDSCIVRAGERVPVDGRVVSERAEVDESVLTGESRPVIKYPDDDVLAGSLLLSKELNLTAVRVGSQSSIGRMSMLIHQALAAKTPTEQLADRITVFVVPMVLLAAGATVIALMMGGASADIAILRAVTILVIACPCALGIATPLAKVAIIGKGKELGIVIRDAAAFEQAHTLNAMVFDKTGTVTEGKFTLRTLHALTCSESAALQRIAAVECKEEHFLAREIKRRAAQLGLIVEPAADCRSLTGLGVTGRVNGEEVIVGSRRLLRQRHINIPEEIAEQAAREEEKGLTVIFAAWQNRVQAMAAFGDLLKPGVPKLIADLRAKGIQVWLVSGDSQATTAAIAAQMGVTQFAGRTSPRDKVRLVRKLQAQGGRVGMIGDGVNDSAALAQADVGFGIGCNLGNIIKEAADVTLPGGGLDCLPAALELSRMLVRVVRQNLGMLGLLNPLLAVFAMLASSLTVIGNTLRIAKSGSKVSREAMEGRVVDNMVREPAKPFL